LKTSNKSKYYGPDYELDVRASNMENANSRDYLDKIKNQVIANLRKTAHAPSVQSTEIPRTTLLGGIDEDEDILDDADEDMNKDVRHTERSWDKHVTRDDEFDESDDEEQNRANGVHSQPGPSKRRNIMDYQNPNTAASDIEMDSGVATPEAREEAVPAVIEANAEVNAKVMEAKVAEAGEAGPSNAPSAGARSNKSKVDVEGDTTMEEPSQIEPEPTPVVIKEDTPAQVVEEVTKE
jgi:histone deacetylase 1/2